MKPVCRHFNDCGGCSLQDISYLQQVSEKKERLKTLSENIEPGFISSPEIYGFRNKMEFSFEGDCLGLHRRGKFDEVVNLEECPVFSSWVGEFLEEVREFACRHKLPYYRRRENKGLLRFLILKESKFTDQKCAVLVVNGSDFKYKNEWAETVKRYMPGKSSGVIAYKKSPGDSAYTDSYEIVCGSRKLEMKIGDMSCYLSPYSFFQPNSYQVENLYSLIKSAAQGCNDILELYSGIGAISFYLAEAGRAITGVESSAGAVEDAHYNLEKGEFPGSINFIPARARPFLAEVEKAYNCIILDPPRGGISYRVFRHIDRIVKTGGNSARVIYISCSFKNLKKDLQYIAANTDWQLKSITGIDQFVHTPHIETAVEFTV